MCRKTFFCMNEHYLNASHATCDHLSNEIHSFDWLLNIDTSCDSLFKKNKVYNLRLSNLLCFDTLFKQTICNPSLCAKATIWYLDQSGSSHCLQIKTSNLNFVYGHKDMMKEQNILITMKYNVGAQYFVPLQSMFGAHLVHGTNMHQIFSALLRHTQALLRYMQPLSDIFRTLHNHCI